ncbi:MAG TPA: hypothetical protein VNZ57_05680, partial [Longimicrobiales bacterium]|nr:hypothetical protein [Longimicrobiales bacterium]
MPVLLGACDLPTVPARAGDRAPYDFALEDTELVMRWPRGAAVRVYAAPGPDAARDSVLGGALVQGVNAWN